MNDNAEKGGVEPEIDPLESEAQTIFYNVFDFFGTLDDNGRVLDLSGSIFDRTNTDPRLLVGQRFSETVFWQSSENTSKMLEKAIDIAAGGKRERVLLDFRISADKKIAVELCLQPLKKEGEANRIFLSAQQVSERKDQVEHYKQEIAELLFAAENAEIGLWFWDLVEDKIYSTPKCNELFEIPAYDILTYETFLRAVHPDDRVRVDESLRKAHLHGTRYKEEYRVVYSDGTIEWISAEGKSFLDENGNPEKMTSVVRKITDQKIAGDELSKVYERERKARDEAVEANRSKDFFLAFVSHELRSPLNAILGWSKILLTKTVDDETRKNALETIERSARFQTKLINDLVDSARVASGKLSLEFRPTNLFEIVRVSYHSQKPSADVHNIEFDFDSDRDDIAVFGDAGRLQQVFSNLISNAIKFTPEDGRVNISIETGTDAVKIHITDTGRGISPDALPNIFRQFSQGDLEQDKNKGGLGLGLSIVNILVGKHGGTVTAQSEGLGHGSTFTVTLPLTAVGKRSLAAAAESLEPNGRPLFGVKILLVEDDADSREVLQLFLEQSGATVKSAASAKKAMTLLSRSLGNLPDVIISDLAMPDEDGYSMITRIRSMPIDDGGRLPALALSAFATNESKQKALEAGFDKYCTKPFEPDLLIKDVLELVPKA